MKYFFKQCSDSEFLKFDWISFLYLWCVSRFRWLWKEPLIKLPLSMKCIAGVFSGFRQDWCRFWTETVRGGYGL